MAAHAPVQVPALPRVSPVKVYTTSPEPSSSTAPLIPRTCSALNTTAFLGRCCAAPKADDAPHQDPASNTADTTPSTPARKPVRISAPIVIWFPGRPIHLRYGIRAAGQNGSR